MREITHDFSNTERGILSCRVMPLNVKAVLAVLTAVALISAVVFFCELVNRFLYLVEVGEWISSSIAAFCTIAAFILYLSMRRVLRIIRDVDGLKLVVEKSNITLEFPIECFSGQVGGNVKRGSYREVYLQLIDPTKRSVILISPHNGLRGPYNLWSEIDIEQFMDEGVKIFEVSGKGVLSSIQDCVERLSRNDKATGNGARSPVL